MVNLFLGEALGQLVGAAWPSLPTMAWQETTPEQALPASTAPGTSAEIAAPTASAQLAAARQEEAEHQMPSAAPAAAALPAAPTAAAALEPVLEMVGWNAESLLMQRMGMLKRTGVHLGVGVAEVAGLIVGIYLAEENLIYGVLFGWLLMLPLLIAVLKLMWAVRLVWAVFSLQRAPDFATAVQQLGQVHSRSFWLRTSNFFMCISTMLMTWYAILMLATISFEGEPDAHHKISFKSEPDARKTIFYLFCMEIAMGFVHWICVIDLHFATESVKIMSDLSEAPEDKLQSLFRKYRSKAINIVNYGNLLHATKENSGGLPEEEEDSRAQQVESTCAVCLEDFTSEDYVSQLPCGHMFHTVCAHKWIRVDWRCPYRCALETPAETKGDMSGDSLATRQNIEQRGQGVEVEEAAELPV